MMRVFKVCIYVYLFALFVSGFGRLMGAILVVLLFLSQ